MWSAFGMDLTVKVGTNGRMPGLDLKTKSKWQSGKFIAKQMHNKHADGVLNHLYEKYV